jgi:hypothetical protein
MGHAQTSCDQTRVEANQPRDTERLELDLSDSTPHRAKRHNLLSPCLRMSSKSFVLNHLLADQLSIKRQPV